MLRSRLIVLSALAATLGGAALAQAPESPHGHIFFKSSVGSFKIAGSETRNAEGVVTMQFNGTVLITGAPTVQITGDVRKEYENSEHQRTLYHGTGKMVVSGKFKGLQFFGRDVVADWKGWGLVRLYGEFDRNLNTGEVWYAETPNEKEPWGNYGRTMFVPREKSATELLKPKPVVVPPKKKS